MKNRDQSIKIRLVAGWFVTFIVRKSCRYLDAAM